MMDCPKEAIADYEKARTLDHDNPDMPSIVMGLDTCRYRATWAEVADDEDGE
jgi:hypothetical protein